MTSSQRVGPPAPGSTQMQAVASNMYSFDVMGGPSHCSEPLLQGLANEQKTRAGTHRRRMQTCPVAVGLCWFPTHRPGCRAVVQTATGPKRQAVLPRLPHSVCGWPAVRNLVTLYLGQSQPAPARTWHALTIRSESHRRLRIERSSTLCMSSRGCRSSGNTIVS